MIQHQVVEYLLLPDEREPLEKELKRLADQRQVHVIFTTGGTGFSVRDITPEATIAVCDRMANGIADAIRNYSMTITPRAMFSRAVSGLRGRTLIVNLPGSPKAVQEALEYLLPHLEHGISVLRGILGVPHICMKVPTVLSYQWLATGNLEPGNTRWKRRKSNRNKAGER